MDLQQFLQLLAAQQGRPSMVVPQRPAQPMPIPASAVFAPQPPAPRAPAAVPAQPAAPAGGIGDYARMGRLPAETPFEYDVRRLVMSPFAGVANAVDATAGALRKAEPYFTQSQAEAQAQQKAAETKPDGGGSGGFPTSFRDPVYDAADANASKITGVPVELIRSIRLNGERSNADQVSSAGARTPYQIIPSTRQGIIKNYKIDPMSNPTNAALGAAYVLREQAGNPGPKDWTPQLMAKAAGGYYGGAAGANNPFGGVFGEYTQRVLGPNTGLPAPFLNPYDPSYDQQALAMLNAGRSAALAPSHFDVNAGPAPEMPKPEPIPTTDFSAADQALQAMKPVEMTAKEELRREHQGFFRGIAQAMMQTSGNEGLGTFLMRIGGAALGGRLAADDEIQKDRSRFEDKMAAYQAALFNNELGKAKVHASEAQAQVQQTNEYAMNNWKMAYDRWQKGSQIDVSGTNAVVRRQDPNTGAISVDVLPIAGAVNAAFAQQAANVFSSMGGRNMAGQQQITGYTNALIGRQAIQQMSSGPSQESDAAAAAAPAFYGTFIATHGLTPDLLGPDGAKSLEESISKQLQSQQMVPGSKDWQQTHDRMVATELAKLGVASPDMMKKMMQVGGVANSFEALDAARAARTTSSTDAKGQTTTRTTAPAYTGAGADLFDSGAFNQDLADHGYSRY